MYRYRKIAKYSGGWKPLIREIGVSKY